MKKKWLKQLSEKSKLLIDTGYTLGPAMTEAWYALYDDITQDCIKRGFSIGKQRDTFWEKSIDELESYENEIIEKHERYPCRKCGWFMTYHSRNKGYCNNFCIDRTMESRCISDTE